jgi:2-keto-4-pentenoate hydratase/2-oxohepta-3-ene-1,7-dioic acid hydratase (catechol pathway)
MLYLLRLVCKITSANIKFNHSDLVFSVPTLVSFLSQGTTLPAGTIILTGTPPGVGAAKNPKEFIKAGDEFAVELLPHVGTLINKIEHQ